MSLKKIIIMIGIIVILAYLAFGVIGYIQGLNSQLSIRICPPGVLMSENQLPDCQTQQLDIKRELGTAPVIIIGWLPLMLARMSLEPNGIESGSTRTVPQAVVPIPVK